MRNVHIDKLDQVPRKVIAIGTDYPKGLVLPWHKHRRAQFLYGGTGVMHVFTHSGSWVVPPQRAVWIPPLQEHKVVMVGVSTRSLYIEPESSPVSQHACHVLKVSSLMRELLMEAIDIPLLYDEERRDGVLIRLLLSEIARSPELPFFIPLPKEKRLSEQCHMFLEAPDIHHSPENWAQRLHVSIRTFSRLFRNETGMSFMQWKQQVCVVLALAKLTEGESVTSIALEFGYEGTSAFSAMFRRLLGQAPSEFIRDRGEQALSTPPP